MIYQQEPGLWSASRQFMTSICFGIGLDLGGFILFLTLIKVGFLGFRLAVRGGFPPPCLKLVRIMQET